MAIDAVVQSGYRDAAAIEPVSVAMRHRSLVTTQRYYGRLKKDQAFATIKDAFRVAVQK